VADPPAPSVSVYSPVRLNPLGNVDVKLMLLSVTLPTLVIVIASVTPAPGVVLTSTGSLVTVNASICGMVTLTVTVSVIAGLVVLVAVTWKESTVPTGGIG